MSGPPAFRRRADALERLEWETGEAADGQRARLLRAQARAAHGLRRRLQGGRIAPVALRGAFARLTDGAGAKGLDALDALLGLLLAGDEPGEPSVDLGPDGVPYQPSPARVLLALVEALELGPADRVCDLGSGLGAGVLLVAWLSAAAVGGIEVEPAYHAFAQRAAGRLKVPRIELILGDARQAPLGDAGVYYLFTPFRGSLLQAVLDRLRGEAGARPIRLGAYGPCVAALEAQPWLKRLHRGTDALGLALFEADPQ